MKPAPDLPAKAPNFLSAARVGAVFALFFASGLAALVYEVLWMKELGLLFGNTAHAAATTLAAFFLGLAVGGYQWGMRAAALKKPLRTYGVLELAVAVSVVGYFLIVWGYHRLYPILFDWFGESRDAFLLAKFMLALVVLFPPAYFMGGTLPVMSQYVVREMRFLGRRVSFLYAVNTAGAAFGALLAGFYLPIWLGFVHTYLAAMGVSAGAGMLALTLSRGDPRTQGQVRPAISNPVSEPEPLPLSTLCGFAFLSGLVTLSLQVLWTRMFAQVLQNSVYTFSTILVTFLLCLALGAGIAHAMMRTRLAPLWGLFALLTGAALLVGVSPFMFESWTDGLHYLAADADWDQYLLQTFAMAFAVMGPPLLLLGGVFPLTLKLAEPYDTSAGRLVGRLIALNTAGAIVGSVAAGFFVLDRIGLWAGIRLMGIAYLLAAAHLVYRYRPARREAALLAAAGILLLVSVLDTSHLPRVHVDPVSEDESLLEVWEGSAGTVAVVERKGSRRIKVNNYYTLGGTGSRELEALQGDLPILLHRDARSVYFLGLGTGITAGAGLKFPVERLTVTELVPEVVEAARKFFADYNNGLFADPRARIVAEDGRNYLAGTREKFDVIVADLFIPWKAGTGSLYTYEHYRTVSERLAERGLFMQWLPAYQLSRDEFAIIARTMLEVFPQVTVWRGDFSARKPIIGLLGQLDQAPLPPEALLFKIQAGGAQDERVPLLAHYVGNLGALRNPLAAYPVNRDDRPIIEYRTPVTERLQEVEKAHWLAGEGLIHFMSTVQEHTPVAQDPYLRALAPELLDVPRAGLHLHRAQVLKAQGYLAAAKNAYERYGELLRNASR